MTTKQNLGLIILIVALANPAAVSAQEPTYQGALVISRASFCSARGLSENPVQLPQTMQSAWHPKMGVYHFPFRFCPPPTRKTKPSHWLVLLPVACCCSCSYTGNYGYHRLGTRRLCGQCWCFSPAFQYSHTHILVAMPTAPQWSSAIVMAL